MVCESKVMYGIELWRFTEAWEELDKVNSRFCTFIPNCAANGYSEMKLGRQRRRAKGTGQIVKCWYRIVCLDTEAPVKQWHECQGSNTGVLINP